MDDMTDNRKDTGEELQMDVNWLSNRDLDELARLVVRKLRESMRQEMDRSGR